MTVRELITKLLDMDMDAVVLCEDYDGSSLILINTIEAKKDIIEGDQVILSRTTENGWF